jgi:NAD(P)-dependent dehydrogenase (short-subunit alcohol dehydrogenase family)
MARTVLITGANRGLGFNLASVLARRGWTIYIGARQLSDAVDAAETLAGHDVHPLQLDVTNEADLAAVAALNLPIDVLINNAGVAAAWNGLADAPSSELLDSFMTNALGPFRLTQMLAPAMAARGWGRVVNVSSGMGGITEMGAGAPAYRISKAALNAVTKVAAEELKGSGVLVNAVCPGWIATRMGGENAPRSVADGVASVLWAIDQADDGATGKFLRDGVELAW